MTERPMKTVVALSKRYDGQLAVQLNALGHLAQAVGNAASDLEVADYRTADGTSLGKIGRWPLVVLAGGAAKVEEFGRAIRDSDFPNACFVETMISGGSDAQVAATSLLAGTDLPVVAVAVHGPADKLDPLTRRLSLWRAPK